MSFSFHVKTTKRPMFGDVLDDLPFAEVLCCEVENARRNANDEDEAEAIKDHAPDEPWPDEPLHYYVEGATRAVELGYEPGAFLVRIMSFSTREEYDLAYAVLERLAEQFHARIEPEDSEPLSVEEWREQYGEEWVSGQIQSLFAMLPPMVDQQKGVLVISGPVRHFCLGKRLMKELKDAGPADELTDRLIEAMRRVQYIDTDDYFCASAIKVSKPDGESFTCTAWGPEVRYLMPDVQFLAVIDTDGHFLIPASHLADLAGDKLTWLDEVQAFVEAYEPYEWEELLERARPLRTEPGEGKKPKRKPGR